MKNPFVQRQILELKNHPRLSRLLAAEYAKAPQVPVFVTAQTPVFDAQIKHQHRDLNDLGFNAGPADGMDSELTDISLREFRALYGDAPCRARISICRIFWARRTALTS